MIERTVGVARFVRWDPWRNESSTVRLGIGATLTVASVAVAGAFVTCAVTSDDPLLAMMAMYLSLTVYIAWATAYIRRDTNSAS